MTWSLIRGVNDATCRRNWKREREKGDEQHGYVRACERVGGVIMYTHRHDGQPPYSCHWAGRANRHSAYSTQTCESQPNRTNDHQRVDVNVALLILLCAVPSNVLCVLVRAQRKLVRPLCSVGGFLVPVPCLCSFLSRCCRSHPGRGWMEMAERVVRCQHDKNPMEEAQAVTSADNRRCILDMTDWPRNQSLGILTRTWGKRASERK